MIDAVDAVLPESPLWERVHRALQSSPYVSESSVQFATRRGEVILHGMVNSFFHKQMAQEVILRVDGVQQVKNRLEVSWD